MSVPFEINDVPEELNKELLAAFTGEREGFLHVGPKKYLLASAYRNQAAGFYNMEVRPDDLWIVTFPRSGTTWTQEMMWLINNNFDYEKALNTNLMARFPFIDLSTITCEAFKREIIKKNEMDQKGEEEYRGRYLPGYNTVKDMKSPRHLKSHLPLSLLSPKLLDTCKVVYVARNPKDVAVSLFYQNRLLRDIGFEKDFDAFWDLFQRDLVLWAPFWSHVEEAWEKRSHPNLFFLFYEEMKKDLQGVVHRMAEFLNKEVPDKEMDKLVDHLSIESKIGGWRKEFSPELNAKADEWIREHEKFTDLRFEM
ncbi:hypothetical protein J437_LFUL006881 [Ladona fulva]|uniref:Sulfotransferase domain-containing protein n=1 Tax=Ladona fulva TaxID=123851 RepID=A0A8K0KGF4_LADFU|nr:hypothetical protein J437_LFUL006881 [Ladona fulva]